MSLVGGISKQKQDKEIVLLWNSPVMKLVEEFHEEEKEEIPKFILELKQDLIGTLSIENSEDLYQVVQGEDNEYYLDHDSNRKESVYGSIFLDYRNELSDPILYLYGHHMSDGQMFAKLLKYEDITYLENHRTMNFLDETWRVVASGKTMGESMNDLFVSGYNKILNQEHFQRYMHYLEEELNQPIHLKDSKQCLILSTCYDFESDDRFLVILERV